MTDPEAPSQMLTPQEEVMALALARRSLELFLPKGHRPGAEELGVPPSGIFHAKRAVFVTLKKRRPKDQNPLRGCIGHILPVDELWASIRDNAISAAVEDHRFQPVTFAELGSLELDISVLTLPREIPGPEHFEVGRHGVILEKSFHRAVFLPQVASEQGWNRDQTLTFLAQKAGLGPEEWKLSGTKFKVFEAQVFGED